jgi:hypothetical protein
MDLTEKTDSEVVAVLLAHGASKDQLGRKANQAVTQKQMVIVWLKRMGAISLLFVRTAKLSLRRVDNEFFFKRYVQA